MVHCLTSWTFDFRLFDIRLRQKKFDAVLSLVRSKNARSKRDLAVYINKHNFLSIQCINRVNVQQLINDLIHGETTTLIWTQPRPTSTVLYFRRQWWAPPAALPPCRGKYNNFYAGWGWVPISVWYCRFKWRIMS